MGGVTDESGYESAFVVNVNWNSWNGNWNVNTYKRDDNKWNDGVRVFSPETIKFLPWLIARKFLFAVLFAILLSAFRLRLSLLRELRISYHQRPVSPTRHAREISAYRCLIAPAAE